MVELYSGTPGSGKSLYATYELIRQLKIGRGVIANFDINQSYFKKPVKFTYKDNSDITVDYLVKYSEDNHIKGKEHQTLIIIDEAGTLFNCRDLSDKNRKKWIKFFTQHRKLGFDVILICQFDKMLDKQIRSSVIETECKFRNIKNYKTFGWVLSLIFGGLFIKVDYWYGAKLRVGSQIFTFRRKKASIYDTYKLFE